ncbi:hypothetical protein T01_4888 [Trichinella spiralis]|uniref:Uncharacterized protein n=1 Tax=Trichinella spiralis TaxID=6334 RepID=A0A0V1B2V5_TRISP|nr:hypothetical protein T01_4888 [Trichinella spiralis]
MKKGRIPFTTPVMLPESEINASYLFGGYRSFYVNLVFTLLGMRMREDNIALHPHTVGQQSSTVKPRMRTQSSGIKICIPFLVNESYCSCYSAR